MKSTKAHVWEGKNASSSLIGCPTGTLHHVMLRGIELVGNGLILSLGGWSAVKALRRAGDRELSDDRILGSGEFVEQVIKEAEGKVKYQLPVKEQDRKIDEFITNLCKSTKVSKKN